MDKYILDINTIEQMFCNDEGILAKFKDTSSLSIKEWLEEKNIDKMEQ